MNSPQTILPLATICSSPNCDERPKESDIDLLVIHNISLPPGEFGSRNIHKLFQNQLNPNEHDYFQSICELRVSSHLLIDRAGLVTQFVPFNLRAWHAGVSSWQGRERCNDYSIGIELEGTDDLPYADAQYERLAEVTGWIKDQYPKISNDRIVGHSDIAPGRKSDPGAAFDWQRFRVKL